MPMNDRLLSLLVLHNCCYLCITRAMPEIKLENDRFKIYDRCPMTDVAMATSTDADVAYLDHLVTS